MLEVRSAEDGALIGHAAPGNHLSGLHEGTRYVLNANSPDCSVYIDDVHIARTSTNSIEWCPNFYAGRVKVEVAPPQGEASSYFLCVNPQTSKSNDEQFKAMVLEIREFEQSMLGGLSSSTMPFGREGRSGLIAHEVQLTRLQAYGPQFLRAVEAITRWPHRSLAADAQVLPLSRVRHLHPSALHDRRIAAIARGAVTSANDLESLRLRSLTSSPTFDTPANRALLALARRFLARVLDLTEKVTHCALGGDKSEQELRVARRMWALRELSTRATKLLQGTPFNELSAASTSSAGLTQIAANPHYSRAYRIGCQALALGVEGVGEDELHVNFTWGIYETWCFLAVLKILEKAVGLSWTRFTTSSIVNSDLAYRVSLGQGKTLELHLQAKFPALSPSAGRSCRSISRERVPDILLVESSSAGARAMVLDAKWRSGRPNVLEAMESAHIYHDSLRVDGQSPSPCLLLLPGSPDVPELANADYIRTHEVGAIHGFGIDGPGLYELETQLSSWLSGHGG